MLQYTIYKKANPMLNSHPLYWQNPTQPTTNRKIETDFGEKDFNNKDALHVCTEQAEYLWV